MRRRIICLMIGAPLALMAVAAAATAAVPTLRHIASGLWNVPDRLPALPDNSQVHYQQGADDYARVVSAVLPSAITRVEAVHGRHFARPVPVGVYATPGAFEAASGQGSSRPVGVTFAGRVNLSPVLYAGQRRRIPAILTHERSHAPLQGWIGGIAYIHLPNWFKEGLAVMVSGGGGAELVSEEEARAAIQRGEQIVIKDTESLQNLVDIPFERAPANKAPWYPVVLAYRQAGMFVNYLRESDGAAFDHMMNAILERRAFAEAVAVGYHADVHSLWQKFTQTTAERN